MFFVLASAVILVAASLAVAVYNEAQYRQQSTQAANVQARVLAETVTAALAFGDHEALQEYVERVARQ